MAALQGLKKLSTKMMKDDCLVCNTASALSKSHIKNVFQEMLPDGRSLTEVLGDILSKSLNENSAHSKELCSKCYQRCVDYEECRNKMSTIKSEMAEEFSSTILKTPTKVTPVKTLSKVVVPASKLLPVPADFQLNFGQLSQAVSKANVLNKAYNFKLSVGSSLLNPQTTPTVKITGTSDSSNILPTVNSDMSQEWDTNMLPKDIFSTTEDENQFENNENQITGDENQTTGSENETAGDKNDKSGENADEDEHEMEIDEDCSMAILPDKTEGQNEFIDMKTENFADIITLTDGNFKIFNSNSGEEDDDDEHTIVVNGDNASILEMMTGQKVIYENGGLSLVMEEEGGDGEGQDSGEESQIELQVSGDEETTNAIIAAAQEQGGAFIKVESGEMYRVKSIASTGGRERDLETASEALETSSELDHLVSVQGQQYTCNVCSSLDTDEDTEKLMDRSEIIQHMNKVHDLIIQLPQVRARRRVDTTDTNKNTNRLHVCTVCNKYYNSRTLLSEHMNTHTGVRPYSCHICEKTFTSKYSYQAHMKTHEERPRSFQCNQCNKAFLTIHNLKQHEKTHLGVKNFICKICNKAFGTQHNLEIHGVVHTKERTFICNFCGKGFCRKAELADHRRTHTGERPFPCDICGARFAQRSNLHSHRRATHLDDKRHQCPSCHKRFKRRRLLEYHIKASHTGERPLKCELCPATFVYPEHYKKHVKIHSGVRPFFCEICGKAFNSRDNRNTHRFTHSEKKPYECLACGHSYMRKRALIQHMNESGHLAESIVVNQPRVTRVHKNSTGEGGGGEGGAREVKPEPAIFCTTGKLESLDKSATTLISDGEGNFFIDTVPIETEQKDASLLQINTTQETQATHFGTDENGAVLRLIQVKLPNGTDGWVALND